MNRPNFPVSGSLAWTASLAGQLTGLMLVLAPAVTHPLSMDGEVRVVIQLLAAVAGSVGVMIVAAGLLTEVVPAQDASAQDASALDASAQDAPDHHNAVGASSRVRLVALAQSRFAWTVGGLVALVLVACSVVCLVGALSHDGAEYLPATVMFALTAAPLAVLLWITRGVWTEDVTVDTNPEAGPDQIGGQD